MRVDGFIKTNPDSLVREDASIVVVRPRELRGSAKLRAALKAFRPAVRGRIALDVGAAAGGFTRVLLEAGATRVYAVDTGYGQLIGSLRQDRRVVNLEATNVGELNTGLVPDLVEVITVDVSYLSLAEAVPQLESVDITANADLIALVKPMFELRLGAPPSDDRLPEALAKALDAVAASGWRVMAWLESPVRGAKGAKEFLIHARRGRGPGRARW